MQQLQEQQQQPAANDTTATMPLHAVLAQIQRLLPMSETSHG